MDLLSHAKFDPDGHRREDIKALVFKIWFKSWYFSIFCAQQGRQYILIRVHTSGSLSHAKFGPVG